MGGGPSSSAIAVETENEAPPLSTD